MSYKEIFNIYLRKSTPKLMEVLCYCLSKETKLSISIYLFILLKRDVFIFNNRQNFKRLG